MIHSSSRSTPTLLVLLFFVVPSLGAAAPIGLEPSGLFALRDASSTLHATMGHTGASRLRGGNVLEIQFGTTQVVPNTPWAYLSFEMVIPSDQATPAGAQFGNLHLFSDTGFSNLIQTITFELDLEPRFSRIPVLFEVSLPSPQIGSFSINRSGSTSITIDNWQFSQTALVPTPGSVMLLGCAMFVMTGMLYRRRLLRVCVQR